MSALAEEESGAGKRIIAIVLVVVLVGLMIIGGFFALFMGVLAAAAGAADEKGLTGPDCIAAPAVSSTGWGSAASLSTTPLAAAGTDTVTIPYGNAGSTVTLGASQVAIAVRIITIGRQLGVSDKGLKVALMTALQESRLRMLANSNLPASLNYPHDGVGHDHDSVNPFQQRTASGWGTVEELMDLDYSIKAFFGGAQGPNGGSPRGLLDVKGWEGMKPGVAAQTVQVSDFPTAYDKWEAGAEQLVQTLGAGISGCTGTVDGEISLPLKSKFNKTSGYGPRKVTVAGASSWHAAIDLQRWPNPCGDPVYAILPGKVVLSSGLWLSIEHPDGYVVSYLHMYKSQRLVNVGDEVVAGQQVGVTGNVQPSSGCHLDLRINVAKSTNAEVSKLVRSQDETRFRPASESWNYDFVDPEAFFQLWGVELCDASCQ